MADSQSSLGMAPLAVDLFTGVGGWVSGLTAAGFRVVGYDIVPKPAEYPADAEYIQADVLELTADDLGSPSVIVASPPCQGFSLANAQVRRRERPNAHDLAMVRKARELIDASQPQFHAIENVRGALRHFAPIFGVPRLKYGPYYFWGDFPPFLVERSNAPSKFGGSRWWPKDGRPRVKYVKPSVTSKIPEPFARPFGRAIAEALV